MSQIIAMGLALIASDPAINLVLECDRRASHPADPQRVAPGLERPEMDLVAAEEACRRAVNAAPENARLIYQLGRTIYYQGRHKEAVPYLEQASDIGYPQATFVLAFVLSLGGDVKMDLCRAQGLWRRGVGVQHPWSGYYLVHEQLKGSFSSCKTQVSPNEAARFLQLASDRITVSASAGRIESLADRAKAYIATSK